MTFSRNCDNALFFIVNKSEIFINYDFVSLLIFVLNRVEEYGYKSYELHDRFELNDSILRFENIFNRPIIDEWILIFSRILQLNGFKTIRKKFTFRVSHDVDNISRYRSVPFFRLFLTVIYDLFRKPGKVFSYFINSKLFIANEPINTFDWIMDVSEKFGKKSSFYFITNNTSFRYDYRYKYTLFVITLIRKIYNRGHNIGIHYSYSSSTKNQIVTEWNKLRVLAEKLRINLYGGRMHYLRLKFPETLIQLEKTEQVYDETLTFHESGGFRCGTCFSFIPFNFLTMKQFDIIVKPLILMEASALYYAKLDYIHAKKHIFYLADQCYKVGGEFSLLWHNSELDDNKKKLYYECIEYCYHLEIDQSN